MAQREEESRMRGKGKELVLPAGLQACFPAASVRGTAASMHTGRRAHMHPRAPPTAESCAVRSQAKTGVQDGRWTTLPRLALAAETQALRRGWGSGPQADTLITVLITGNNWQ